MINPIDLIETYVNGNITDFCEQFAELDAEQKIQLLEEAGAFGSNMPMNLMKAHLRHEEKARQEAM